MMLGSCLTSRRVDLPELQQLPPQQALAVYHDGRGTLIDSAQVRGDTLFGRTLAKVPNGPRPLFIMPLVEADSIRTAHPDRNGLVLFAIPLALALGFFAVISSAYGSGD